MELSKLKFLDPKYGAMRLSADLRKTIKPTLDPRMGIQRLWECSNTNKERGEDIGKQTK